MEIKPNYRKKDTKEELLVIALNNYAGDINIVKVSDEDRKQTADEFNQGYITVDLANNYNYANAKYIATDFEPIINTDKTLNVTDNKDLVNKVSDIEIFGEDVWKLICKASSKSQGWMKSTKAMEIAGIGCVIQVTTQQGVEVSEAVTFVPNVRIHEMYDGDVVIGRKLVNNQ